MHVTVIGAGIGGLTTAITLRQRGITVEVYERSAALGDVGAGIGLWANALKALHQVGLKAPLDARSFSSDEGALRTVAGAVLSKTSSREIVARFGMPFTVFHRAELLEVLREAARDIPIHLDHECLGVIQGPDIVSVGFAGGRQAQAAWSRLGPVPGDTGRALNERFHRAVTRFFDQYRRKVPPPQQTSQRERKPVGTR